uniref:Uncharacterized protein n=1 Tax=Brassica oleracea TaxID=3712 RepID=A0A3P6D7K4_BRAOL|nr:unnamed protein product [Brassica oleracea]
MEDNSILHIWDLHLRDQQECSMATILTILSTIQHKVAIKLKLKHIIMVSAFDTLLLLLLLFCNTLTCLISNSVPSLLHHQSSPSQPLWLYH